MALIQEIKDGQVVSNTTDTTATTKSNQYDKDMFLQLLVAEMKYQDPLEPTSNSEYVAELASFSQIEATEAVEDKMDEMSANNLVGKYVVIENNNQSVAGPVDYVMKDDDGNYQVAVNDGLYSIDDITIVADEQYYNATILSETFSTYVSSLPSESALTIQDADKVAAARTMYDSLTDYQKGFLKEDDYNRMVSLENRIASLQ